MSADPPAASTRFTLSLEVAPATDAPLVEGQAETDEERRRLEAQLASTFDPEHVQLGAPDEPRGDGPGEALATAVDVVLATEMLGEALDALPHGLSEDPPAVHPGGETN